MSALKRRVLLMIGRAVLTVVDADRMTQSIQVEALQDEVIDEFEHMEPYGFTSHPHPGAEAITRGARRDARALGRRGRGRTSDTA